ncbi:DUF2079 domain-containing protein [Cryobacterium algoritolerans]|uniref:DUF2079 domain-containing protein n=1 Tax=Cryobacterium algoritolerans TaxID=1259184 RepID=A0A4R8WIM6_9MICO|nr:DUF2079 domain-containing protein [Cryobacterium algoritolerans]TFC10419.1 DUF2079 domain-containing protein [Cryobacterium algoritolerans]
MKRGLAVRGSRGGGRSGVHRPAPNRVYRGIAALSRWNVREQARANAIELTFVVALTALYSALALRLHLRLETAGYDLGIFEQAIRNYSEFRPPIVEIKGPGFNLLADHFHPILVLLAPFYALVPTSATLLVAQAFLFALAAAPLVAWARRSLGIRAALAVGVIYGFSFGIASAVGFDFHEIAFAVPLLAFSLAALGQGHLRQAAAWAIPLILVKEDLGATAVAVIGALIFLRGARRLGSVTVVIGIGASLLEVLLVLPLMSSSGAYAYWSRLGSGPSLLQSAVAHADVKLSTVILTLAITGFAALASPLVLVAVPTLIWRFISTDPFYWGTTFHYSAVLMPIVVASLIDALSRLRTRDTRRSRLLGRAVLTVSLAVTVAAVPSHAFARLFGPTLWEPNPRIEAVDAALALIPGGATIAASDNIAPQLISRTTVTVFGLQPLARIRPDWILVDPYSTRHFRVSRAAEQQDVAGALRHGYVVALERDGIALLRRTE